VIEGHTRETSAKPGDLPDFVGIYPARLLAEGMIE
jgi:hypothetical protein